MSDTIIKNSKPISDEKLLGTMLMEIQSLSKIAILKEDDNVIRGILRGKSRNSILIDLQEKYPKEKISVKDLNDFLLLNRDILFNEKTNVEKAYVRRLIKSKDGLNNQLIDLAVRANQLVDKYDEEGDNANAISALRTAADIFMKVAKVEGLAKDTPEINVNMQMDKVVSEITTQDSTFKNAVMKIINNKEEEKEKPIEADYKVDND